MVVEEELHIPYWDTKHRDSIRSALCQHAKKQGHVYITASFDGELLIKRKK